MAADRSTAATTDQADAYVHEPEDALGQAWYCLRGLVYYALGSVRMLPLCGLGVHRWCGCCSPVTCRRCGASGHD